MENKNKEPSSLVTVLHFIGLGLALLVALLCAIILGDVGPWYFAWLSGTVMICLITAASGILFETELEADKDMEL
ncbi:MAG: hypothetical protein J6P47_05160 [Acetobacter sp.]|nr:hypothetical protein [Acetobacter sp.]MBQ5478935.1 hypothetical protein [Acetobacter sp.]